MSLRAHNWAWDLPGLKPTQRYVLLRLAAHADELGAAWPSVSTIAKATGLSDRAVRDALRDLENRGAIRTEHRVGRNGAPTSSRYVLSVSETGSDTALIAGSEPGAGTAARSPGYGSTFPRVRQHVPQGGEPSSPPYIESFIEFSIEPALNQDTRTASQPRADLPADQVAEQPSPKTSAQDLRHEREEPMNPPSPPRLARPEPPEAGQPAQLTLTAPGSEPVAPKAKAKRKEPEEAEPSARVKPTWEAFCAAKKAHPVYGRAKHPPVWNATIGGMLAKLLKRIPAADAPEVAAYFVRHPSDWYAKRGHRIGDLLANAETLHEEWSGGGQQHPTSQRKGPWRPDPTVGRNDKTLDERAAELEEYLKR